MIKIQHKTESIHITSRGVNVDNNNATANIFSGLESLPVAISLFGDGFTFVDGQFTKSLNVAIPNLNDIGNEYLIEQSDLGKTVNEAMSTYTTNVIFELNLLELNLNDWEVI